MSYSSIDVAIRYRPDDKDLEVLGPAFAKRWEEHFVGAPDKPVVCFGPMAL